MQLCIEMDRMWEGEGKFYCVCVGVVVFASGRGNFVMFWFRFYVVHFVLDVIPM